MIRIVISGGQTGVDRAALDAANDRGVLTAGWAPGDRKAQDGRLLDHYPLVEIEDAGYPERTIENIRTADATLILTLGGDLTPGTRLTMKECRDRRALFLLADLRELHSDYDKRRKAARMNVLRWLGLNRVEDCGLIRVLNVAGPSERSCPGIYSLAYTYLAGLFRKPGVARRRIGS